MDGDPRLVHTKLQEDGILIRSGWQEGGTKENVQWRHEGNFGETDGGNLQT